MTLKGNPRDVYWGREQEVFKELKRRFTTAAILSHFYPGRKTVVKPAQAISGWDAVPIPRKTTSPSGISLLNAD